MAEMSLLSMLLLTAAVGVGPKVVVPSFATEGSVEEGTAAIVAELVLTELQNGQGVSALGPDDIARIMDLEAQQQLIGCESDGCFAELVGALNADFVLTGQIGRLGSLYVLTLKVIDPAEAKVIGRVSRTMKNVEEIATELPQVLAGLVQKIRAARPGTPASGSPTASGGGSGAVATGPAEPVRTDVEEARRDAVRVIERILRDVRKNDRKGFEKMVHPAALQQTPLPVFYFTKLRNVQRGRGTIQLCPDGKYEAEGAVITDHLDGEGQLVLCLLLNLRKGTPQPMSVRMRRATYGWRVLDWTLPE